MFEGIPCARCSPARGVTEDDGVSGRDRERSRSEELAALPDAVGQWSLTSLREKLIKIGAKIMRHGRYVTFQMAEVVIPRDLFADILRRIDRLRLPPAPA